MGLLDELLGSVLRGGLGGNRGQTEDPPGSILGGLTGGRGAATGGGLLLQLALLLLQQNGGLGSVLGKFRDAGMGSQADSWVSSGRNQEISAEQVEQAFGPAAINDIASKLGVARGDAGSAISQIMPELINQLTPRGEVTEESENSVADALQSLSDSAGR
ncbi:MAG TPA: YidB family protein [Candidatus Binatia bacterium]|nr:YidB family protein [Candidatus Binatia bacterium]